jgi:hypothetical protein
LPQDFFDPNSYRSFFFSSPCGTKAGLFVDPTIQFTGLKDKGVSYAASFNAELFKQLRPAMVAAPKNSFPS